MVVRDRRSIDQKNQSNLALSALIAVGFGGVFAASGLQLPKPWWWMLVPLAAAAAILSWRWYGAVIRRAKADGDSDRLDKVRLRVYWAAWCLFFGVFGMAIVIGTINKVLERPRQSLSAPADEPVERGNP
jgi:hypothetical protein